MQVPTERIERPSTRWALLFPGQGAQAPGMGKDLAESIPEAKAVFERADEALGFGLSKLCFEGPAEELNRTDVSQPAILAHSWAVVEALKTSDKGMQLLENASASAGLSLGEYTALAAAGAIAWEDALRLVRARGTYMQEACDAKPSTMASILGLDREPLEAACASVRDKGVCVLANFNADGQIVIAGDIEAINAACEAAKEAGAKRAIPLSVAGAFHSPLMEPARERLAAEIDGISIKDPEIPVVANVTAKPVTTADEARRLLVAQLTSPVMWADSMQLLVDEGYQAFYELGPGTVLAGLLKRVAREQTKVSIGSGADLNAFLESA
ncbi:MAG: ACP S-malonyltransferase [Planctomycetes bacterium]|nr:ACP S-malonyltransferase [Planctomycetota bacterium]